MPGGGKGECENVNLDKLLSCNVPWELDVNINQPDEIPISSSVVYKGAPKRELDKTFKRDASRKKANWVQKWDVQITNTHSP